MKTKMRKPWQDESNTWIAYTDFLTAVLILFVIIATAAVSRGQSERANLYGQVIDNKTKALLSGCVISLATTESRTDKEGKFSIEKIDLSMRRYFNLVVTVEQYEPYKETIELKGGDNFKTILLNRSQDRGKGDLTVELLDGDAYFEVGSAKIKPEALAKLLELGRRFRAQLRSDEVIVVQGHTDDQPYKTEAKSNWELSGERAAAVCRAFQEEKYSVGIPGYQLLAMGYGEFHPLEIIKPDDLPTVKESKRTKNRRIEIRKLKGAEVFASRKL
ncbi:MAG: OmpA family protein [Acidobacteriota bacterium]